MILDANLEFCDAVSVAAAAGTSLIGNQIDTTNVRPMGNGRPVYLVINVDTAIITGGSAGTLQFQLVSDDSAAISTTTSTQHLLTAAFVTDDSPTIPAGTLLYSGALPTSSDFVSNTAGTGTVSDGGAYRRYIGILATVGTTTITAGKINAFLTFDPAGYVKTMPQASV